MLISLKENVNKIPFRDSHRGNFYVPNVLSVSSNRGVATSMISRHKKLSQDLIVVLHLKSCGVAALDAAA